MKKVFLFLFLCGIISAAVSPHDLEIVGGLGNLSFKADSTSPLSNPVSPGAFRPQLFPLALVRISGEHNDLAYNGGFERDPMGRNRLFANLKAEGDYFSVGAGPFIGLFNSSKLPINPGVSTALGLGIPGIVFVRASGSSTLGTVMDITGNYSQSSGELSVGFWVPYVICSLNMSIRSYTIRENSSLLIEDEVKRYFFTADVFTKNIPYTVKVDIGYQSLKRSYVSMETDEFKSVYIGLEGRYTFSPALKFLLGGEMPVYSWGVRPMEDPPKGTMLFQARAGVIWTLPVKDKE